MTTVGHRALTDRLERALAPCRDVEAVARAVFTAVAPDVPFGFACLATTDPATELITGAFKSAPLPIGDEDFAAAEYGGPDVNQFAEIARRPAPVGVLSIDTGGAPQRCRRFRDFMAPQFGFTDELRLACRARNTTWALLALYRGAGEPPFSGSEAGLLAGVHERIADGVQRALFAGRGTTTGSVPGAAVLVVDGADRVTDLTAAAYEQIDDLGGWVNGSLPTNVLAVAALARASARPATTRVRGRSGRWLGLQAMALDGGAGGGHSGDGHSGDGHSGDGRTGPRSVVVTVDAAAPAAVGQMALAARGLTAREQEIAQLVLRGASTKAIAASLFLSPHTVQDHLKAVFRKLGVTSRRELIAQLVLAQEDGAQEEDLS